MKKTDLKDLSVADLEKTINQVKKDYFELKLNHAVTPLKNPLQIRSVRRAVARLATEITKRQLQ